ncbi:ATP-binding cassette domain-containing protein [Kocuria rhizophila]|nr:ATP-binding cassette domain-containing protein [Kocuria rhizophila]
MGLEDIAGGDLKIDGGTRRTARQPRERNLSIVFQNYASTAPLRLREHRVPAAPGRGRFSDDEIDRKVREAAETLDLTEHLERKPANLSGGQRQRVAMGRAIVRNATRSSRRAAVQDLDAKLRGQMRTEIAQLQRRMGITFDLA